MRNRVEHNERRKVKIDILNILSLCSKTNKQRNKQNNTKQHFAHIWLCLNLIDNLAIK